MTYSLFPYFGSPVTQTIVISDSEYKALRQARAIEEIERIENRIRNYEAAIKTYTEEIASIKEQVGLLPETDQNEQITETTKQAEEAATHEKATKVLKKYYKYRSNKGKNNEEITVWQYLTVTPKNRQGNGKHSLPRVPKTQKRTG